MIRCRRSGGGANWSFCGKSRVNRSIWLLKSHLSWRIWGLLSRKYGHRRALKRWLLRVGRLRRWCWGGWILRIILRIMRIKMTINRWVFMSRSLHRSRFSLLVRSTRTLWQNLMWNSLVARENHRGTYRPIFTTLSRWNSQMRRIWRNLEKRRRSIRMKTQNLISKKKRSPKKMN